MNDAAKRRTGDPCDAAGCAGRLVVYATRAVGDSRVRYLHCNACGRKPRGNKWIIPLEYAPRRSRA